MKRSYCLTIPFFFFLPACGEQHDAKEINEISPGDTAITGPTALFELPDTLILVGSKIDGDFNGDGETEQATTFITSEAVFQEKSFGFQLLFSDKKIPALAGETLSTTDTSIFLVNEGDLGGSQGDEITLCMPPMNGSVYMMQTFTLSSGKWKEFMEPILIPAAFYELQNPDLQRIIFVEEGIVYYNDVDPNAREFTLIRHKADLINR